VYRINNSPDFDSTTKRDVTKKIVKHQQIKGRKLQCFPEYPLNLIPLVKWQTF